MKVGIVGNGVVGAATARSYTEHCEVRVYDQISTRRTHSLEQVLECDVVFICLPTPQVPGAMHCDTSAISSFFHKVGHGCGLSGPIPDGGYRMRNYVIKSTVPIGTTKSLHHEHGLINMVHSPEFLTARCSLIDAMLPARNIIGYPARDWTGVPKDYQAKGALHDLYQERFPHVPILRMTSTESEAVKLIQNSFFAVKVAFWNETRTLIDRMGLEWDTVMEGILADGRVDPAHTKVPGPDGKFGFGGTCLPKDLANLINTMRLLGVSDLVCSSAYTRNETIDRPRRVVGNE